MPNEYEKYIETEFKKFKCRSDLDSFFKNLANIDSLSFEDREFLVDQFRWAEVLDYQLQMWISDLLTICRRIERSVALPPEVGMFFIRLHGALTEMVNYFEQRSQNVLRAKFHVPVCEEGQQLDLEIYGILIAMKKKMVELDLLAIEFIRNQSSHLFVDSYRIGQTAKGFKRVFGRTGKPRILQLNAIIKHLMPHQQDHRLFARALVPSVFPYVIKLDTLMRARSQLIFHIV